MCPIRSCSSKMGRRDINIRLLIDRNDLQLKHGDRWSINVINAIILQFKPLYLTQFNMMRCNTYRLTIFPVGRIQTTGPLVVVHQLRTIAFSVSDRQKILLLKSVTEHRTTPTVLKTPITFWETIVRRIFCFYNREQGAEVKYMVNDQLP